jgi:hypothetical protein
MRAIIYQKTAPKTKSIHHVISVVKDTISGYMEIRVMDYPFIYRFPIKEIIGISFKDVSK